MGVKSATTVLLPLSDRFVKPIWLKTTSGLHGRQRKLWQGLYRNITKCHSWSVFRGLTCLCLDNRIFWFSVFYCDGFLVRSTYAPAAVPSSLVTERAKRLPKIERAEKRRREVWQKCEGEGGMPRRREHCRVLGDDAITSRDSVRTTNAEAYLPHHQKNPGLNAASAHCSTQEWVLNNEWGNRWMCFVCSTAIRKFFASIHSAQAKQIKKQCTNFSLGSTVIASHFF